MASRWLIGAKLSDGRCGCIYVHFDGYPSWALVTLTEFYNTQELVDQLIALGDCRSIGITIEECEPYASLGEPWDGVCPTYSNSDDVHWVMTKHAHGDEDYFYQWDGQEWHQREKIGY